MDVAKFEQKIPDMVMCGDHPSFTKTELNAKIVADGKPTDKKDSRNLNYTALSPKGSRTAAEGSRNSRVPSEQTLRALDARRRAKSLEAVERPEMDIAVPGNKALLQAALGSFRWPPYLLAVWVLVLVLTHVLHCLVTILERTLPRVKKACEYCRGWCEETWREESSRRLYPALLTAGTGVLYVFYYTLYVLYSVALWAIEPLSSEIDEKQAGLDDTLETKIITYTEDLTTKSNSAIKS